MSLFAHYRNEYREQRAAKIAMTQEGFAEWLSPPTAAGVTVTPESSLAQTTVYACVRLLSETVGTLPCLVYRRLERGKERAVDHPLYTLLHDLPNPELTPIELFENLVGHLALWGNAYCEIEYDGAGRRRAVWPLRPDRVQVIAPEDSNSGEREYAVMLPNGKWVGLQRWQVWHVRGWGTDGWVGKSPIALAREAIGAALATEQFGARFFQNDSRPGGILKHPGRLTREAAQRLRESWESAHAGLSNRHRVAVLEEGIEWQQIGIPPEDAQFIETMKFHEIQICQLYRVPPHMIGIVDKSTSWGTGIEQQSIGFKTFTLMPYLTRLAQSITRDLLTSAERGTYFVEFLTAALVQADINARYRAYGMGRQGGWLSVNDIRELENMNPVPGGDIYLQPLNMAPLGSSEEEQSE